MLEDLKRLDAYIPVATSTESIVKMWVQKEGEESRNINARFTHGAEGLVTEVGEIQEALDAYEQSGEYDYVNLIEEAGDVIWYLAIVIDSLGLKFVDLYEQDWDELIGFGKHKANSKMIQASAQILNKNKRTVFYGKPLEVDDLDEYLKQLLHALYYFCQDVKSYLVKINVDSLEVSDDRTGIEIAIDKVTRKLTGNKGRYKDGFSQEEAYNRDLDNERKVLEE
jgi:NTP pyrophosphatase (non-canonical NTP hydrolase)